MWFLFSTLSIINYNIANYFTIFSYMGFFIIGNYLYTYIKDRDLTKYNWFLIISIVLQNYGDYINTCDSPILYFLMFFYEENT